MNDNEYSKLISFMNNLFDRLMQEQDYDHIMYCLGATRNMRTGRWLDICHDDGDGYNLSFNYKYKRYTCFSRCNCSYSLLELVKRVRERQGLDNRTIPSLKWICEQLELEFNLDIEITELPQIERKENEVQVSTYKKEYVGLQEFDKQYLGCFSKVYHQSWLDYGISKETMDKYNIGFYKSKNMITIPCYDELGRLVGVRGRNVDNSKSDLKYMPITLSNGLCLSFPTSQVFYGEMWNVPCCQKHNRVFLVEAEKSVLKANDWFGDDNNYTLALYGSALTEEKLNKLKKWGIRNFYIGLDSDFRTMNDDDYQCFRIKVLKFKQKLDPIADSIYVVFNNQGYDGYKYSLFDFTREQFDTLWKSKVRLK